MFSWGDGAAALQLALILLGIAVSWTYNIQHRAPTKVAFTIAFLILGTGAWYAAKKDRQELLAELTGGDNYLLVKAVHIPSGALSLSAFNDGDIPLPDAGMCAMPPGVAAGQEGYKKYGCAQWLVVPAHDRRGTGILVTRADYGIELNAANGPANETLVINAGANTQHLVITRRGQTIYDREISIP